MEDEETLPEHIKEQLRLLRLQDPKYADRYQQRVRKQNERKLQRLHNEGRLRILVYEISSLPHYITRTVWIKALVEVTPKQTEPNSLALLRKGRRFNFELIDDGSALINFEVALFPCPYMFCKFREDCQHIKEYIKGPKVCVRKEMREVLQSYRKREQWRKLVPKEWTVLNGKKEQAILGQFM